MYDNFMKSAKNNLIKKVNFTGVLIALIITPWVNIDSMIIPKMILLFFLALYCLPYIFTNKEIIQNKFYKWILFLLILNILQILAVLINSDAPLEQQIFGRVGRGLGIITQISLLVVLFTVIININFSDLKSINLSFIIASVASSFYCVLQSQGLDPFAWVTRTNGIIGTLGNPNFQSSFAAMGVAPVILIYWHKRKKYFLSAILLLLLFYAIYLCRSIQGYLIATVSIILILIISTWYQKKLYSISLIISTLFVGILSICGMLNMGPLATYLYKVSVTSRGEFWRSAINTANSNPIFGTGIDSFGDVFLRYRDENAANGIGEFTDNAHNYFLEYAATGGYPLMLINITIILVTLVSIFKVQKNLGRFDNLFIAIFISWTAFQMQSIISPGNITSMFWNMVFSGVLIGLSNRIDSGEIENEKKQSNKSPLNILIGFLLIAGALIIYPLYNSDKELLTAYEQQDAVALLKVAQAYPESTVTYQKAGKVMLESGLFIQALDIGRAAVEFNPNAVSAWALILGNPKAPMPEREKAALEINRLDPFNKVIKNFKY